MIYFATQIPILCEQLKVILILALCIKFIRETFDTILLLNSVKMLAMIIPMIIETVIPTVITTVIVIITSLFMIITKLCQSFSE